MADNVFDQFHEQDSGAEPAANVFDQFHEPANKPGLSSVQSTPVPAPARGTSGDFTPIGDAPPDFGNGAVTPGEMDAAGTEFRRLGSITAQAAGARTLNLGATLQQGMNPSETIAARLTGLPDEYTQAGQMRQMAKSIAPNVAPDDRGGRLAEMVGGLAPDLVAATATGGLAELPAGASLGARALQGAATMALPAAENTREAYNAAAANGLTPAQAAAQAAIAGGGTLVMGAIPANIPGDLATRALSGTAIAGLQTEGQRRLANALLPDDRPDLQQPFDAFNFGAGALTGGVLAGALGHGAEHRNAPPSDATIPKPTARVPSTDFVADTNGNLREVPRPPEQPAAAPPVVPPIDPNAGPISRAAAQVVPAHQAEQGPAPAAPRFPGAAPGSLSDAANTLGAAQHEQAKPFDTIDPAAAAGSGLLRPTSAEMPRGLGNPFEAFPTEPAFRVEPLGSKGLLVHGDPQAARDALAAAGFPKRGRTQDGALRFDAADRDAIENALQNQNGLKPESTSLGTITHADDGLETVETSVGPRRLNTTDYDVGYGGSSQKDGTVILQRGFDYTIKDGPLKGLDTRPFLAEHEAVERNLENTGNDYTAAHKQATDAEHAMLLDKLGLKPNTPEADNAIEAYEAHNKKLLEYSASIANPKDAPDLVELPYEHPHSEEQRRLLEETESAGNVPALGAESSKPRPNFFDRFGSNVAELSPDELTPQEREAFDRQRSTVVNDHTFENAPPELRDLMLRESGRSAARELQRRESVQSGQSDADRLGLRSAVNTALGDSGIKVNFVRDESGLPDSVKLSSLPEGAQRSGLFDPDTKQAYVFTKVARTPEQAAFTAAHEVAGHNGLRALAASRPDVLLGGRTPSQALNDALDLALKNATVAKIADSMARKRSSSDRYRMAEEALADLAGATRTGDWARIKDRHGVDVSDSMRGAVHSMLANFIARVKQIVGKIFGHETFTDAQVHALIQDAWKASQESSASTGRGQVALDSAHSESPGQAGKGRLSEDELHEAHSLAKRAVLGKAFDITPEGKENVVRYNGKEVARIAGPVNRSNLTKAIAEQLKPAEAKSGEQTRTTAPLSDLPPRGPGEERGAWLRRVSNSTAGEDVRRATALRAEQKIIGRHAIREMLAGRARAMDTADAIFGEYRKLFDKTHPEQNFANVDAFETGKPIPDADFRAFLTQMKPGFVQRVDRLRELNPNALQHLVAHYLPHMYEDPQRAAQVLSSFAQRNSVAGDKGFLKQREWPTLKQAMDSGLRPITSNPVDWVLLRYAGMDKLIGALELRQELQGRGWLHKVIEGEQISPGYRRVSDPTFNGYAVPANFARDLNNYLDPGFSKYAAWRTLRGIQNFMVAADLGFSGFHAVFTSTDNVVMHLDVAARRAAIGDSRGAAATLVKALTSVATSPFEGHKLNQQWRGIREADANTAAILDALERGGARWKMSTTEYQNAIPKMARMFRQMQGAGVGAHVKGKTPAQIAVGAVRVPATALQAVAEMGSYLIHHVLVPNQKAAARVLLYKYELDRRAQDLGKQRGDYAGILDAMHPDVVRQLAAQVNDVVDYRLGQMAYDNRFWNRTVQDVAQAAVMAPGWQFGMIQTVAGAAKAVKDLVTPQQFVAPLDKAGTITDAHMGRVGSNLSYFLTLALTLGGGMAALQYLLIGKGPDSIKDYFFPKTGRKNDDDSDERLSMPNYWVDHYKLSTEPARTAENKIHPLWKMLWEVGHNRDYFGTRIRDPNAPAWDQALEVGAYMAHKFLPITVSNMQKGVQHNESTAQQVGHFFGINNAPAGVARSEFQNFVMQGGSKGWGEYTRTPEEAQRRQTARSASAAIRRGDEPDFGNLTPKEAANARKDANQTVPALLFKRLSDPDKLHAYDLATPDERARYSLDAAMRRLNLDRSTPFKNLPAAEQAQLRQRLQTIRRGAGEAGNVFEQFDSQ